MQSEYTQDVTFNSDFGALQTPVHLTTALALSGWQPNDISGHFRYLDLACGNGHTLSLLAESHPHAEFVGIDINAEHVAHAQKVALDAGITNVTYLCADLLALQASEFEPFDYCTISGVYSWLDAERQNHIFNQINRLLTPNGVLYLDYCALPGITQTATLYSLVQQVASQCEGSSAQRLTAATQLISSLHKQNGPFFESNRQAAERFSRMLLNPAEDEAHEVLNLKPNAVWSKEIIDKAEQSGLTFAGSAGLHHNLPEFSRHLGLPGDAYKLPVSSQQMLQDVAWNVAQRKDIYCKQSAPSDQPLSKRLGSFHFYIAPGALNSQAVATITHQFPAANLLTQSNISLLSKCAGNQTLGALKEVFTNNYNGTFNRECTFFDSFLAQLLATRVISLAIAPAVQKTSGALSMPSKLNQLLLKQDIHLEFGRPLCSPVTGTRLVLPLKDRLYLWALTDEDLKEAWQALGELRGIFHGPDGKRLNEDQFVSIIQSSLPAFKQKIAPELVRLGILQST